MKKVRRRLRWEMEDLNPICCVKQRCVRRATVLATPTTRFLGRLYRFQFKRQLCREHAEELTAERGYCDLDINAGRFLISVWLDGRRQ